jgi:agmatinase
MNDFSNSNPEVLHDEKLEGLFDKMERTGSFIGASDDYEVSNAVIIGYPMDFTVSFRPGSRLGPRRIRELSYVLEEYSWYCDATIDNRRYHDMGDLVLPFGSVEKSLAEIEEATSLLLDDGKFVISLGGEHLVTLPIVKALAARIPDLVVIQFDAHADLREDYMGQPASHAAVIRRISEFIDPQNIFQFGIRSGSQDELACGRDNTNLYLDEVVPAIQKVLPSLAGRPIYLTIDIDVADPAYAPGTGTPEPGGINSRELLQAIKLLADCTIVGMDIVEVAPAYDHGDITSVLAAKLIRESLLQWT